ncbi:MAG: hypothetical protein KA174_04115 [Chitinophagales bacterium]|nr:hypothetical protein [Chitinophagales bacterium]
MNNLLIAAITFVMLPAISKQTFANNKKEIKNEKTVIAVEKLDFSNSITENEKSIEMTSVNVDYIIDENGKAFITYLDGESVQAKNDVLKFIENATYNFNITPNKIYSMKLLLNK